MALSDDPRIFRLPYGRVSIRQALDGVWRVSYDPDEDQEEGYPGHTFAPGDPTLPADYPATNNPDDLELWARGRWGASHPRLDRR
jgi:hypothetical protein